MVLIGLRGRHVNTALLLHALEHTPSLVIDCSNAANPHALFPLTHFEKFKQVFVVQAELIYTFRDVFKHVPLFAREIGTKTIIVTTFHRLFNYQNETENNNIFLASWERMKALSQEFNIYVGVHPTQESYAQRYCDHITEVNNGTYRLESTAEHGHHACRA